MTLSFVPDFLAKTQCPGQHSFDEFTIPAPLDFVREDEVDRLLCLVRTVIRRAYVSVSEEESRLLKVNAHEARAIATNVLFRKVKSLDLVLKAGTWKSMTTFASFYLRDAIEEWKHRFDIVVKTTRKLKGSQEEEIQLEGKARN
ncbi:hypothetical protein E2C01_011172 [Portunus trituberculatus]|uniref:Uncharacterized protein n=1 Tax=Portunus trituberculatus TaxID=210409 RepID=A0A5B7DAC5_PORTR|nr:hypothetical protein [Portunus trituberculatus]